MKMIGFIYWFVDVGYAFKFYGAGYGVLNIFFPYSLAWDGFQKLVQIIHP